MVVVLPLPGPSETGEAPRTETERTLSLHHPGPHSILGKGTLTETSWLQWGIKS